jgi:lysophospholipase L1-like esterase
MQNKLDLKPNQTILFIGDSITDADRNRQAYKPFGFGYVHFIAYMLLAKYPTYNLNIINRGINGNTITDLKNRWQRDCIDHNPGILSILIGVNDVWRRVEEGDMSGAADLGEYDSTYRLLVAQAKQKCNSQLVICEPFMFCDDLINPMFQELRHYVEIVRKIAADFNAVLVPLQKLIDEQIDTVASEKWSDDMMHPHIWVHCWIAQQWLLSTGLS